MKRPPKIRAKVTAYRPSAPPALPDDPYAEVAPPAKPAWRPRPESLPAPNLAGTFRTVRTPSGWGSWHIDVTSDTRVLCGLDTADYHLTQTAKNVRTDQICHLCRDLLAELIARQGLDRLAARLSRREAP